MEHNASFESAAVIELGWRARHNFIDVVDNVADDAFKLFKSREVARRPAGFLRQFALRSFFSRLLLLAANELEFETFAKPPLHRQSVVPDVARDQPSCIRRLSDQHQLKEVLGHQALGEFLPYFIVVLAILGAKNGRWTEQCTELSQLVLCHFLTHINSITLLYRPSGKPTGEVA